MGRGKIEIKKIESSSNRGITYNKRKKGIIKKAEEISILCGAQVSVVIIPPPSPSSGTGKIVEFCSPSTVKLENMVQQYHKISQEKDRLWDAKHEHLQNEINRVKKENESMQVELRHLKGEDINSLHFKELQVLEDALENGATALRAKQTDIMRMLRKGIDIKEEEHQALRFQMRQMQMGDPMHDHNNVMENQGLYDSLHHQTGLTGYEAQMPFAFRIQPMQPNLQDNF